MRFLIVVALICSGLLVGQNAFAQETLRDLDARFDQQLANFDPAAVKAARSYQARVNFSSQIESISQAMRPGVIRMIRDKNPNMDEAAVAVFWDEFSRVALVEPSAVYEKMSLIMMLETLDAKELTALDNFYASEIGQRVMAKLPKVMGRVPEMIAVMQKFAFPPALEAARAKLRARGKDIKI